MPNRLLGLILGLIVSFYLISSCIFVVDQRKFAVVFAFGQIVRVIEQPGLQFKLELQTRLLNHSHNLTEGKDHGKLALIDNKNTGTNQIERND